MFDARHLTDLTVLANELIAAPDRAKAAILADVIAHRLPTGSIIIDSVTRFLSWRHGTEAVREQVRDQLLKTPHMLQQTWHATIDYMLNGRCAGHGPMGKRWAGGWDQDQLDTFVQICRDAGWTADEDVERQLTGGVMADYDDNLRDDHARDMPGPNL